MLALHCFVVVVVAVAVVVVSVLAVGKVIVVAFVAVLVIVVTAFVAMVIEVVVAVAGVVVVLFDEERLVPLFAMTCWRYEDQMERHSKQDEHLVMKQMRKL